MTRVRTLVCEVNFTIMKHIQSKTVFVNAITDVVKKARENPLKIVWKFHL